MSHETRDITLRIREKALDLGFSAVGVTTAAKAPEGARLREWLARGGHAGMAWMNNPEIREDPAARFPSARSVVVVGLDCRLTSAPLAVGEGRIAAFARNPDYHDVIGGRLAVLREYAGTQVSCRGEIVVDSRPLLERAFAIRAGLGWAGESGCVVSEKFGPWLLFGELILDVELEYDAPVSGHCAGCGRCAAACPTNAITEPGFVDAARCVAYLTIEHRGPIPRGLRIAIGDRLFGCDACQDCCQFSGDTPAGNLPDAPGGKLPAGYPAARLLTMSPGEFNAEFAGTPVARTGRARMARNAAVVLGNSPATPAVDALVGALHDPDPVVRSHAAWALIRRGEQALLSARIGAEADPAVREEIEAAGIASGVEGKAGDDLGADGFAKRSASDRPRATLAASASQTSGACGARASAGDGNNQA